MAALYDRFNNSGISRFLNSPGGRIFRILAGLGFLIIGIIFRSTTLGVIAIVWSVFPLSAGAFDICYVSAALGGPISGKKIRSTHKKE